MDKVIQNRIQWSKKFGNWLKMLHYTSTMDMKRKSRIDYYDDGNCFTNGEIIHIGVGEGSFDAVGAKTLDDFTSASRYFMLHEELHCRYTADVPYRIAIQKGCEAVAEYVYEQCEGSKSNFRKDDDWENYLNDLPRTHRFCVPAKAILFVVRTIANSIEDGRIERIGAAKIPGFAELRKLFRGRVWAFDDTEFLPWDMIKDKPGFALFILLNQVLSLACCQVYQKGFLLAYAKSPLEDRVKDLMPDVYAGVYANRTKDMALPVISLSRKLAPLIYETCKREMSVDQAQLEEKIKEMLTELANSSFDGQPNTNLSSSEEEEGDDSFNSLFEQSDLTVTLDDETYDKLMEKLKDQNGVNKKGNITVKREHPLPENKTEKPSESNEASGKSENKDEKSSSDNSSASSEKSDPTESKENSTDIGNGSSTEQDDFNGTGSSGNSGDATENSFGSGKENSHRQEDSSDSEEPRKTNTATAGQESKEEAESGSSDSSSQCSSFDNGSSCESDSHSNSTTKVNNPDVFKKYSKEEKLSAEQEILQEIKEAGEKARENAKAIVKAIMEEKSSQKRASTKESVREVKDREPVVSSESMKDICDFIEVKRNYELSEELPPELAARGKVLRKKNMDYFRGLRTPKVQYQDSGVIDPSRIYGLSMGDTDIFRKDGKDRKFDGCAYILIDNSGSMGYTKRIDACAAAAVIEEGFKGLMPFKIAAFDTAPKVNHKVIKNFDEVLSKNCVWNFGVRTNSRGGNADGYDIQIATRELMKRPEKNKMLIVLSDGMPSGTTPGYTKGAIEAARKKGIQVCGIYFEEGQIGPDANQFREMYQKDYVCCESSKIDKALVKIFMKFSRR